MQSATSWHCGGREKCSISFCAAPILSSRFWCFLTLNEQGPIGGAFQPSAGWASSMYTSRKSATSLKSSTSCRKAGRWLINGGQVAEPKLTTRGRLDDSKSRRWHSIPLQRLAPGSTLVMLLMLLQRAPSGTLTSLEFGASQPSFTYGQKKISNCSLTNWVSMEKRRSKHLTWRKMLFLSHAGIDCDSTWQHYFIVSNCTDTSHQPMLCTAGWAETLEIVQKMNPKRHLLNFASLMALKTIACVGSRPIKFVGAKNPVVCIRPLNSPRHWSLPFRVQTATTSWQSPLWLVIGQSQLLGANSHDFLASSLSFWFDPIRVNHC